MGLLDAYATAEEYKAAVNSTESSSVIDAILRGTSRLLDRELSVVPGAFNIDGSANTPAVRVFDALDDSVLYLRNRDGLASFLISVADDGIGVDSQRDGTFDGYTFDLDDSWVRGLGETYAAGEPFSRIELLPLSGASLTAWPVGPAMVQVAGIFGWQQVPDIIKRLTIRLTHELRLSQAAGRGGQAQYIDDNHALSNETYWLWREAKDLYTRKVPSF